MNKQSPGEIAYTTYRVHTAWLGTERLPNWEEQSPQVREAWEEVAEAVLYYFGIEKVNKA